MTAPSAKGVDVVAFGELVIDLIPAGRDGDEPLYAARPGGAPGNVAAGIARLGLKSAMLTKVGSDGFGTLAVSALAGTGVDVSAIRRAGTENTALACVTLDAGGDRGFALYRQNCADSVYAAAEVDGDLVRRARVLHVGSLSLKTPVSAEAQRHAVTLAREAGALVSADPNLRPAVWDDPQAMAAAGREAVASADIVKLSREELAVLSGTEDEVEGIQRLWHHRLEVLAVTDGANGATLHTTAHAVRIPGYAVDVVDTVGCGDAFTASLVAGLIGRDLAALDEKTLRTIGRRACAAGAIVATRAGAMTRMPRPEEIGTLISEQDRDGT